MTTPDRPLIGSVFERSPRPSSAPSSRFTKTPTTGFPTAQHRSKSAFARARDETHGTRQAGVPLISTSHARPSPPPTSPIVDPKPIPTDADALRRQIHEANTRTMARMTEADIERERRAVLEQLGEGTEQLLKRVQQARRRKEVKEAAAQTEREAQAVREVQGATMGEQCRAVGQERPHELASPSPRRASHDLGAKPGVLRVKSLENLAQSAPSPLPRTSRTRPSSRTSRKLRFAEVTPDDVHVYESAPVSPKRPVLALPPPPDTKDDSIVSLGTLREDVVPSKRPHPIDSPTDTPSIRPPKDEEPEEGTPEDIRRRYFPGVSANDPSVAWMEAPPGVTADPSAPRFDLHGALIPAPLSASLPSHLGLHHHAEGSHAGYTLDDIFLLARSTVPAQRASMLGILAKIAHRLGQQTRHPSPEQDIVFAGQEGDLRKRILAAGLAAIDQIGSLGARAVEVVWECLAEWDGTTSELEGVELALAPDIVSFLQLDYVLPQITDVLSHAALPPESLAQLLAVVHWLAQQSNQVAERITHTPRLVPTILDTFLLTPIPPNDASALPNPLALQLLITLASASRSNASTLLDPADALLRFVTLLPSSSPYPTALATTLLTYTLRFYTLLSSYGLYAHIATAAYPIFTALASYILSSPPSARESADVPSQPLRIAWAALLETWIVCATDPHATSPPHDILWSQVCAWGWATDLRQLRKGLGKERSDWAVYAAIWDAEAAWLEGARINSIKGGKGEREEVLPILGCAFATDDGPELAIVQRALEAVQRDLAQAHAVTLHDSEQVLKSLASAGSVLASALRLWLACLPPLHDGLPLSTPPFALPFSDLSALSAALVKHPIWDLPSTLGAARLRVYLRPLTRFIVHFHRVSRHIPGTTSQLWFAQALVFLSRLLPGDEWYAFAMLDAFLLVTPQFVGVDPERLSSTIHVDVLRPFFEYAVRPGGKLCVAPLRPNTESISRSSTLRLPSEFSPRSPEAEGNEDPDGDAARTLAAGLPLTRDFLFAPLTHLLRSGISPVFRALPTEWTASEVDVVRATLLLAYAARRVLIAHRLDGFVPSAAEVVFACMRVCMLEHGVGVPGGEVEVFRDAGVEQLMAWLLAPFTVRGQTDGDGHGHVTPQTGSLEDASTVYLGATPFYQFYTDLVALYGAVSFGHRTFGTLVVSPLAMGYAVDYRRALWCGGDGASAGSDPGHPGGAGLGDVVRSVRVPVEDVVCTREGGVWAYLYPVERDSGVLGAYVAALVARDGSGVEGFLRFVAVHHVACTIWGDLDSGAEVEEGDGEVGQRQETRARLLRVVLVRGEADVVKDVVLYRQRAPGGVFVWPPTCYRGEDGGAWRASRAAFVRRTMGTSIAERVGALLTATS